MAVLGRVKSWGRPAGWPDHLARLGVLRRYGLWLRLRFGAWRAHATVDVQLAAGVRVGRRVRIEIGNRTHTSMSVDRTAVIGDDVLLRLRGGSIHLGPGVDVRSHVVLNVGGGTLLLDGPNIVSWGSVVHCADSVHLSRFAGMAEGGTIVDSSHFYTAPDEWWYYNFETKPVEIGENVWICPHATITSGVTIGSHSIVGSNSVVVRDVPSGVLVSGVPAAVVRELDLPWRTPSDRAP